MLHHTFAKNLVNQHVGLQTIAALLGHQKLNTAQIYIKPGRQGLEVAEKELEVERIGLVWSKSERMSGKLS